MKVSGTFTLDRETKGALRYNEVKGGRVIQPFNPEALVGTLYLRKLALKGQIPVDITVTVEWGEIDVE